MTLDEALKKLRRLAYRYGTSAKAAIIVKDDYQLNIVEQDAIICMATGSTPSTFSRAMRRITLENGGEVHFFTLEDVEKGRLYGYEFPLVFPTVATVIEMNGGRAEKDLRVMNRSMDVPDKEWLYEAI